MNKYIDAEKLKVFLSDLKKEHKNHKGDFHEGVVFAVDELEEDIVESLQQEQPDGVCSVIKEFYGKELSFEDERTKAAYYFFSAGCAFELKRIEEERAKHITDLLDNYKKGKEAGYKDAVSELKEGKIKCSPVMKELIDKLFEIGNVFNFGFGSNDFSQEQPEMDMEKLKNKAELIANEIMMDVQANKYHTCIYDKTSNDFNHSHLFRAALKGIELGLNARR